jgi:CheY-like chemotaxis protein
MPEPIRANEYHGIQMRTLLCVEDNPASLKLIERIVVRRPGLRLLSAINGISGIEKALSSRPAVILMDINLPDISGFKALMVLRANPATAHIPVIALSANGTALNIESGLEAGFFRYLTKPLVVRDFTDALDSALAFADKKIAKANSAPAAAPYVR